VAQGLNAHTTEERDAELKDRLGDQRGGSEWEPIKILLLRENSAYTPNSQLRIPTRVCHGHVVTTDLPTLGTNPKRSQSGSTKQEAKDLADCSSPGRQSAALGRTVRGHRADGQRPMADCPLNTNRTTQPAPRHTDGLYHVIGRSASNSCCADIPRRPGGRSTKHLPTKNRWPTGLKRRRSRTHEEHKEHLGQKAPRGQSAPTTRTVREVRTDAGAAARDPTREHPTTYPSMDLPNG
jgi:hypothetical protein